MSDTVISVENLSKRYFITHQTKSRSAQGSQLSEKLHGMVTRPLRRLMGRKDDALDGGRTEKEEFWALKDVSFEVKRGDVLGIIGRNGAGKSTLLKILSRITEPTRGEVKIKGRIASLLEVGTGFHPELTGRENIFLNGSILGMSRVEIQSKFDEIVAFAEVEKFLDTQVKHYSSGMYVRLAFAVAAHLDPEILVVDEVLAVGDAQFQKKCLGKMNEVSSKQGRTILFVSHNMGMITTLCNRATLLSGGKLASIGSSSDVVLEYYTSGSQTPANAEFTSPSQRPGDQSAQLLGCYVKNDAGAFATEHDIQAPLTIGLRYAILQSNHASAATTYPQINVYTAGGELVFQSMAPSRPGTHIQGSEYIAECRIPPHLLNNETYHVSTALATAGNGLKVHFYCENILSFTVKENLQETLYVTRNGYSGHIAGPVRPALDWHIAAHTQ